LGDEHIEQNKLHYAVHGMTAAELIVGRVDSEKENMGLTTYAGESVRQSDAKNHLSRDELEDLIGLDVCLAIMEALQAEFGDPKYRPCPLLRKMVTAGYLGRKSGKGFLNT
jgi:hypothetical protein